MLVSGPASIFKEPIPLGVLTREAQLNPPPEAIPGTALLKQNLPGAWAQEQTTAAAISTALSVKTSKSLPWIVVRQAIDSAIRSRLIEVVPGSGTWPCDWAGAAAVRLRVPLTTEVVAPPPPSPPNSSFAEARLEASEIQDLADNLAEILTAGAGLDLQFFVRLELGMSGDLTSEQKNKLNDALAKVKAELHF